MPLEPEGEVLATSFSTFDHLDGPSENLCEIRLQMLSQIPWMWAINCPGIIWEPSFYSDCDLIGSVWDPRVYVFNRLSGSACDAELWSTEQFEGRLPHGGWTLCLTVTLIKFFGGT